MEDNDNIAINTNKSIIESPQKTGQMFHKQ